MRLKERKKWRKEMEEGDVCLIWISPLFLIINIIIVTLFCTFQGLFPQNCSWTCNYSGWEWLKPRFLSIFIQDSNMQYLTMAYEHFWHYAYNFYWYPISSLSPNAGLPYIIRMWLQTRDWKRPRHMRNWGQI
jgi:hypothetical protein